MKTLQQLIADEIREIDSRLSYLASLCRHSATEDLLPGVELQEAHRKLMNVADDIEDVKRETVRCLAEITVDALVGEAVPTVREAS